MREIHKKSKEYPENLSLLDDAPAALFIEGKLNKQDIRAVAIVGSRTPSSYGKETAYHFSQFLSENGYTIVSGLARGIDTIAHKAALAVGGRTIAVVAGGVDVVYPPENIGLYNEIINNGAVLSEFKPGTKPLPKNFLARNRIISGISLAVIVVEGRRRSGTISTATHAANQGKEVFAVPGPINSLLSEAPNFLIEQGAHLAKSPQDILDILS